MHDRLMNWCANKNFGLLLIRLGIAAMFIFAAVGKLLTLEQTLGFFAMLGVGTVLTYIVIAVELLGGIAMLLGVGTRYAGIALAIVMVFAIVLAKWSMGFVAMQIDIMLFVSTLGIAMIGPGRFALGKSSACGCCADCENGVCA